MREDALRSVLLVKSIEATDLAGAILPAGDRAQATRDTMRALGTTTETADGSIDDALAARALADRAQRLVGPLAERYPIVSEVLGRTRTPSWILVLLLLLAFMAGLGLSALDGSRRINILAFPFLGLIAWNLVTYAVLAAAWVRTFRGADARGNARSIHGRAEPELEIVMSKARDLLQVHLPCFRNVEGGHEQRSARGEERERHRQARPLPKNVAQRERDSAAEERETRGRSAGTARG